MRQLVLLVGGFILIAAAHVVAAQAADKSSHKLPGDPAATRALFNQLDANGDGYLSRAEASAAQPIGDMYDSMDTNATLEKSSGHNGHKGIDYQQFKAGLEAARSSGAFGPAVSGGQTYLVYPDGHRVQIKSGANKHSSQANDDGS